MILARQLLGPFSAFSTEPLEKLNYIAKPNAKDALSDRKTAIITLALTILLLCKRITKHNSIPDRLI